MLQKTGFRVGDSLHTKAVAFGTHVPIPEQGGVAVVSPQKDEQSPWLLSVQFPLLKQLFNIVVPLVQMEVGAAP